MRTGRPHRRIDFKRLEALLAVASTLRTVARPRRWYYVPLKKEHAPEAEQSATGADSPGAQDVRAVRQG